MSDANGGGEKTHAPTRKKLDDARREGNLPRSSDVSAAAAYLGLVLALAVAGSYPAELAGAALSGFLSHAGELSGAVPGPGGRRVLGPAFGQVLLALAPVFLLPWILAAAATAAQRAFVFTPKKLAPKLSRISPVSTAAKKFGRTGLFEFAKSLVKMIAVATVLAVFLGRRFDEIVGAARASGPALAGLIGQSLTAMLRAILIVAVVVAAADYFWQRFDHARKLRMSHQDLREEQRQAEGDPLLKGERRARAREVAANRMMADVPGADVVIVNPAHVAVALAWSRRRGSAPACVAKGTGEIAARIREIAAASGVPVHRDPPTARALHALVGVGEEIPPQHYRAVAAAIRFAEAMRRRAAEGALGRA
ncbi:MAG: flagellar biosynthesis protein FlhB [Paracoccaceae bacterium]